MKIHQVFTENLELETLKKLADKVADGWSIGKTEGSWKGAREDSVYFEFWGAKYSKVLWFARTIKHLNAQQAVAIKSFRANIKLV